MEDIQPASSSCLTTIEEEDEFYERIEAPKFVDFTVPDRRPDDRAWFCARIGCDQNHEEVDPDALYRSFMLRVMAARSPNVRFQRALNKPRFRENPRCPQSAPAKSTKNAISRITSMNTVPEEIAITKLKRHPINSLRETPVHRKAKVQALISDKARTSPMNNGPQTKHLKEPATVVACKVKNVVKDNFLHTPKKAAGSNKTQFSEIYSDRKKKHDIDGGRKRTPQGSHTMNSNNRQGSSLVPKKMSTVGSKVFGRRILKVAAHDELSNIKIGLGCNGLGQVEKNGNLVEFTSKEHEASVDSQVDFEGFIKPSKYQVQYSVQIISRGVDSGIKTAYNSTNDDDKENTLFSYQKGDMRSNPATSKTKRSQFETCENRNPEVHLYQGVKLKRTTNPKPFRLRTDERGVLKEANMERRLQVESKKEAATLLKHVDRIQPYNINGKTVRRSRRKSFKVASPKQLLKIASASKAKRLSISRLNKGKRDSIKLAQLKQGVCAERNAGYLQGRKPVTVPKEPKFQKLHVRKNCFRSSELALS